MATRQIRMLGDEILRKKSREVEELTPRIKELINDMFDTMYEAEGVGLAAVQVGALRRIIVIDISEKKQNQLVLINPRLMIKEGRQVTTEGCLSVEELSGKVIRPERVVVDYLDENFKEKRIDAHGLLAKAIMHELDHLEGILFVDFVIDEDDPDGEAKAQEKEDEFEIKPVIE